MSRLRFVVRLKARNLLRGGSWRTVLRLREQLAVCQRSSLLCDTAVVPTTSVRDESRGGLNCRFVLLGGRMAARV
jgi:hypothetical protein